MTVLTKNTDLLKQEVHEHITADAVIQGSYWEGDKDRFIGCLTHCDDPAPAVERFGLTEPILRIAEHIFESLPIEEAKAFLCKFPDAVQCDNDEDAEAETHRQQDSLLRLIREAPVVTPS